MDSQSLEERRALLAEAERIAERVLQDKKAILQYQQRIADNRELLGKYRRKELPNKSYIYLGGFFLKLPGPRIEQIVKQDQERLGKWVDGTRVNMKKNLARVNQLLPSERPAHIVELLTKDVKNADGEELVGDAIR
ncbi:hypothetical protein AAMO2058_000446100 [Amorphochlora amoebiformis]